MEQIDLKAISRLEKVLNNVEGSKKEVGNTVQGGVCENNDQKAKKSDTDKTEENNRTDTDSTPQFSGWYSYFDGKTCKRYYYNHISGVTQWEKPDAADIVVVPPPAPLSRPTDDVPVEKAYFSRTSGRFSHAGSQTYWAMVCALQRCLSRSHVRA